jgi:hypothetical protein
VIKGPARCCRSKNGVSKLEQAVFGPAGKRRREKDWQRTAGMFRDDPIMKQVIDEALRLREEERAQARRENDENGQ